MGFAVNRENGVMQGWVLCVGKGTGTVFHEPSPPIALRGDMMDAVDAAKTSESAFRAALPGNVDTWFGNLTSAQKTQVRLAAADY